MGRVRSIRPTLPAIVSLLCLGGACAATPAVTRPPVHFWAFTAPWDQRSTASAGANAARLDAVVYGWIQLDTLTGAPYSEFRDTLARHVPAGTRAMAIVTTSINGRFHPEVIRQLATSDSALGRVAGAIARRAGSMGYRGLVLDFEGHDAADLAANAAVVHAIADSAHAHAIRPVVVAIPAVDTLGYPAAAFVPTADQVLVMLYDQHWSGSVPGPVAAPDWAGKALAKRVLEVGASKVVAGFPLYGYRWPANQAGSTISFPEAQQAAVAAGIKLARDSGTQSMRASAPGQWELWATDAGTLDALVRTATDLGVHTIALWRLGLEDPAIWGHVVR